MGAEIYAAERLTRDVVRASLQKPSLIDLEDTLEIENTFEASIQASIMSIGGNNGDCEAITFEVVV